MPGPVLLAVDDDRECLSALARELSDRYSRDYRIVCTASPEEALATLERLAEDGEDVALVLAGQWLPGTTGGELLGQVRRLHPHAKRGLLITWGGWGDPATGEAIFDAMAHGRIDYYVLRPSGSPDEVFHQTISSFLLEWARDRRVAPHTIRVVGEAWSGRAYELREVLGRCAIPHTFCLADSAEGRELLSRAGRGPKLPLVIFPDGNVLVDPTNAELAHAAGAAVDPEHSGLRPRDRRLWSGRPVRRRVRGIGGIQHARRRRRRHRRAGHLELADPELPRLPGRNQRRSPGRAGLRAGLGARGEVRVHAAGGRAAA